MMYDIEERAKLIVKQLKAINASVSEFNKNPKNYIYKTLGPPKEETTDTEEFVNAIIEAVNQLYEEV